MDLVSIILCMCIGNMAAWLMAMYMESAQYNLLWNVMIGATAAALWKLAIGWAMPSLGVGGLVFGGPVVAWLAITGFHAAKRRWAARPALRHRAIRSSVGDRPERRDHRRDALP